MYLVKSLFPKACIFAKFIVNSFYGLYICLILVRIRLVGNTQEGILIEYGILGIIGDNYENNMCAYNEKCFRNNVEKM